MKIQLEIPIVFGLSIEVYCILFVLGIPIFFIWRAILKRFIKAEKKRKITTWLITIITTPILYVGIGSGIFFAMTYYPKHDFNRENWANNEGKRYEMTADIIKSRILLNKTKFEVRQLLGNENNTEQSNKWYYNVGTRPELVNIDPSTLEVDFSNGVVNDVRQHN